ncbi:Suppressor of disruption of TFIIS [Glycine soja]
MDYNLFAMDTSRRIAGFKYDCLLFEEDMDDTLYPLSTGLNLACRKNIEEYMLKHLHMEESEVPKICVDLYREYGTTMAGLKAFGHEFDNDEFHAYVHGRLPYKKLKPDPVLRNLLFSMPQLESIPSNYKTWKSPSQVFTNADQAHAHQVLNRLGLKECFDSIICFETLNPPNYTNVPTDNLALTWSNSFNKDCNQVENRCFNSKTQILCKPSVEAIEVAIQIANLDPRKTLFFDDSARNIASGKAAGLNTVIVGRSDLVPGADYALSSIHNIKEALPEIWEVEGELQQMIQSPAVETMVLA